MNSAPELWRSALRNEAAAIPGEVRLMEVCGSHSVAVARAGIRSLLPENVKLLSGPGCPVCVSSASFIDRAIALARRGVVLSIFGDLLKIPGSSGTLRGEENVRVIYSPDEALEAARRNPAREHVLAVVGFEPTVAVCAAVLESAASEGLGNFSVLADFKHLYPVLGGLAEESEISGFLLPGHVAAITGAAGFAGLPVPGVISGFDSAGILESIRLLLGMIACGENGVKNNYTTTVRCEGNRTALALIDRCFEAVAGEWRGLGVVPQGCYAIRSAYAAYDASRRYDLAGVVSMPVSGCRCGEILRGRLMPENCPLFGMGCTPEHPVGSCMVSSEGACMAAYFYGRAV